MICDVQDTGQEFSYGVRGSHTTVELLPKAVELADFVVFTRFTSA